MLIECIQNDGFEDQISENKKYVVKAVGENSFLIENDKSEQRWYGRLHFSFTAHA